jgi:hypothetical protein
MMQHEPTEEGATAPCSRAPRVELCDLRCQCGKLVARMTPRGVELKCQRCRRIVVVEWEGVARRRNNS